MMWNTYKHTVQGTQANANLPYTLTLTNHNPKTNPNLSPTPKSNNS